MPLISILIILKVMLVSIVQIVLLSMVKNLSVLLKLCYFVVLFIHSMSFTTTTTPLHSFQWLHSVLLFSFFFFFLIQTSKIKALTQECIFINRLGGDYLLLDFLFVSLVSIFLSCVPWLLLSFFHLRHCSYKSYLHRPCPLSFFNTSSSAYQRKYSSFSCHQSTPSMLWRDFHWTGLAKIFGSYMMFVWTPIIYIKWTGRTFLGKVQLWGAYSGLKKGCHTE